MARKAIKKKTKDTGSITTAAGLARKLGVHRTTISRRVHKKGLSGTRVGHQFSLSGANQSTLRKTPKKGRPKGT